MKIPKDLPGSPVAVWWDDAWADAGLSGSKEDLLEKWTEGHLRCDCGWIVGKTPEFVMLSLTADPPQRGADAIEHAGVTRVPRDMVRKIIPLCPSSPKRRSSSSSRSRSRRPSATPSAPQPSPAPPSAPGLGDASVRPEDRPIIGVPVLRHFTDFTDHLP